MALPLRHTDIDQDINSPKEPYSLLDSTLDALLVRDISVNDFGNAALFADHVLGVLGPLLIEVDERHFGTLSGQQDGASPTIAYFTYGYR